MFKVFVYSDMDGKIKRAIGQLFIIFFNRIF